MHTRQGRFCLTPLCRTFPKVAAAFLGLSILRSNGIRTSAWDVDGFDFDLVVFDELTNHSTQFFSLRFCFEMLHNFCHEKFSKTDINKLHNLHHDNARCHSSQKTAPCFGLIHRSYLRAQDETSCVHFHLFGHAKAWFRRSPLVFHTVYTFFNAWYICSKTPGQSPVERWRKCRTVGCQGESWRWSSQRQSGT